MSQRSVCTQFTPQLWRATKCKFCFNDKTSHESASKENSSNVNIPPSPTPTMSPKAKKLNSPTTKSDDILRSPSRRNANSTGDTARSPILAPENDDVFQKRPNRIRMPTAEEKMNSQRVSLTSPIENISLRLEMNKQLLAKDDKIHNLEIWNQNLENEIRTLKDQNIQLSRAQHSEEEHKKLLDKIASLRRKLSDMEVKHAKIKEEKEELEERLKMEEQLVSKLKIKINSMEHEHYLLELRVEREQKHKQSMIQEKEEAELELESMRKAYRSMQRESRKFSTTVFDVDEERTRELEENLRQTQRRLGMVEVENNRLKDKINKVETERQGNHISSLQRQLSSVQDTYEESVEEIEDLRASHLAEIQSLQTQISRLQIENDELTEGLTKRELEVSQMSRSLADVDATRSDMLTKDEELQTLRAEVVRLQDKCSALCDVELIHINLNKELDRHRERADRAEQHARQLEREIEEERASRVECEAQLEQYRVKEEECKRKHNPVHPPIRARSLSLEPNLLVSGGVMKKTREPAERDNHSPIQTNKFTKPAPPANRRRPSREHLHRRANKPDSEV